MKSKRIFSFAMILALAVCFMLMPVNLKKADADSVTITKISGHGYTLEYLLEDAGYTVMENMSTISGGRYVEYRLCALKDGTDVAENSGAYGEATFKKAESNVEFFTEGKYLFNVYKGTSSTGENQGSFFVETTNSCDESTIYYDYTKVADFAASVEKAATGLKVGDKIQIPYNDTDEVAGLESFIKSTMFDFSELDKTIYYASSQTGTYTSTTSSSFKVNTAGIYSMYILMNDPMQNSILTTDLVVGPNGWYKADQDGNREGSVIIPIFTFEVKEVSAPNISVETSEEGYLNLNYKIDCFTIDANSYNSEYLLLYSETELVKESDYKDNFDGYINALIAKKDAGELTDVTEELLDVSKLEFTPDKKGCYYVYLRVVDENNLSEEVVSRAILVNNEFTSVKLESQFIKYNLTSIIFLSISFVSLVAIIILVCIKPKDYNVELQLKSASKAKTKKNNKK